MLLHRLPVNDGSLQPCLKTLPHLFTQSVNLLLTACDAQGLCETSGVQSCKTKLALLPRSSGFRRDRWKTSICIAQWGKGLEQRKSD